jgi:hypothetical protein
MTSLSPGRKKEHVVAPLPLDTGVKVGVDAKGFMRPMRSHDAVAPRACMMSWSPAHDQ